MRPDDLIVSLDFADLSEKSLEKQILLRLGSGHWNRELRLGFLALRSDGNRGLRSGEGGFFSGKIKKRNGLRRGLKGPADGRGF